MYTEILNAKIEHTFLGEEDHGIPTLNLFLSSGGIGGSFGGHDLRYQKYQIEYIMRVLSTIGVKQWEDLPGKYCRVKVQNHYVVAIGHIIDDVWFEPKKDLDV